jgi:hypothetical protein
VILAVKEPMSAMTVPRGLFTSAVPSALSAMARRAALIQSGRACSGGGVPFPPPGNQRTSDQQYLTSNYIYIYYIYIYIIYICLHLRIQFTIYNTQCINMLLHR